MLQQAQDAEAVRACGLRHTLTTAPLPHVQIADRRAQRDRRDAFHVPHLDDAARLRAARNELAAGLDRLLGNASLAVGAAAVVVALGAAAQVVAQYVGGAL